MWKVTPSLQCDPEVVSHDMVNDDLRSHASVYMGVKVCSKMVSVVVYPIPPMFFGVVHGGFTTLLLRFHVVLYPSRQYLSSKP